jgi:Skp family chaperone for outer membrane proteins
MAKSLTELTTIRDILMGELIEEYNERIEKIEARLKAQQEALDAKEADLNAKIAALDELLDKNSKFLAATIEQKTTEDRQALGALFLSLGQQLKS